MAIHPLAGQLAPASVLIDVPALEQAYYTNRPDPATHLSESPSARVGIEERQMIVRLQKRTSWPSPRRSVITAARSRSMDRFFSARTLMRFRARPSERRSRFWRRKASRRYSSVTTA